MKLPNYLEPFRMFSRPFPEDAVKAVVARREEAVPELLQVVEGFSARWAAGDVREDEMLHEYAMQLLAEFRETQAYRPMVRIARMPEVDEVLGDSVTDVLPKMLAAVWDGDSEPLLDLIGDPMTNEFARSAGLSAIGILFQSGRLDRTQLRDLLGEIYEFRLEREPVFVWDAWVAVVADFGIEEELKRVRTLYAEGLADPGMDTLASVEKRVLKAADCESPLDNYEPYTTVSEEMGWWYCFSNQAARDEIKQAARQKKAEEVDPDPDPDRPIPAYKESKYYAPEPHVRDSPKVGRNDPCPCGSGKKYKKCCL